MSILSTVTSFFRLVYSQCMSSNYWPSIISLPLSIWLPNSAPVQCHQIWRNFQSLWQCWWIFQHLEKCSTCLGKSFMQFGQNLLLHSAYIWPNIWKIILSHYFCSFLAHVWHLLSKFEILFKLWWGRQDKSKK